MFRKIAIVLCVILLSSCKSTSTIIKTKPILTPTEVAQCQILPTMNLPPPLDLSIYKIQPNHMKIFYDSNILYFGLPEEDMQNQLELLLVVKTRVFELQRTITDAQKLMQK